jgi:hypothetical protein
MGDPTDSDAWREAFAREAEGDASPLVALFLESTPLHLREKASAFLRRIQPRRTPSQHARNLAKAYFRFHDLRAKGKSDSEAHKTTRDEFKIAKASVLDHVLSGNRSDVNPLIGKGSAKFSK